MHQGTRLSAIIATIGLAGCSADGFVSGENVEEEVGTAADAIIGGTLVAGSACPDGSGNECINPSTAPGVAALIGYGGSDAVTDTLFCTGYLIAPGWVATAAHCFDRGLGLSCLQHSNDDTATDCEVDLGRVDWWQSYFPGQGAALGETFFHISHIYVHENYNSTNYLNDIALIELESPVPLETAPRAGILRRKWVDRLPVGPGTVFRSAGWGANRIRGEIGSQTRTFDRLLRIADDNTYFGASARCEADTDYDPGTIQSTLFCSGSRTPGDHDPGGSQTYEGDVLPEVRQGTCQGDSGGPVYYNVPQAGRTVIGSTSWGIGCALQGFPDVNTRVGDFVDAMMLRGGNPFGLTEPVRGIRTPAVWASRFAMSPYGGDAWFQGTGQNNAPVAGDFTGDGYTDVAYWGWCGSPRRSCFRVHENTRSGSFRLDEYGEPAPFWSAGFRGRPVAGDFNGDRRDDFAYLGRCGDKDCWAVHVSNGSSTFRLADYGWSVFIGGSDTVQRIPLAGDFNNDGYADVTYWGYCGGDSHACWRVHMNNRAGKLVAGDGGGGAAFKNTQYRSTPMVGDFNGDDADDIAYLGTCGANDCWLVQLNDGDGDFAAPVSFGGGIRFPGGNDATQTPIATDLNGDGFADIAHRGICDNDNHPCIRTYLNNRNGGTTVGDSGTATSYAADIRSMPIGGDFDGDGATGFGVLGTCSGDDCWEIHQLP